MSKLDTIAVLMGINQANGLGADHALNVARCTYEGAKMTLEREQDEQNDQVLCEERHQKSAGHSISIADGIAMAEILNYTTERRMYLKMEFFNGKHVCSLSDAHSTLIVTNEGPVFADVVSKTLREFREGL